MKPDSSKTGQKHLLVKPYSRLSQLADAIEVIAKENGVHTQLSVLGKLGNSYLGNDKKAHEKKEELKAYWKQLLGPKTDFGFFSNPTIGSMYITGPLVSMFLQDIDGKKLGTLSGGPYGILRGLGIHAEKASADLKLFEKEGYLLLIRAYDADLRYFEDKLTVMNRK